MMSVPTTHYVYYKLLPQQAAAMLPRVQQMQQHLRARHALHTGLHQRLPVNEVLTWMETYQLSTSTDGAAFLRDLDALAVELGLQQAAQGGRKLESFTPMMCDDVQMTKGDAPCA